MSKNVVETERLQMTIWLCVERCIIKATPAQAHACCRVLTTTCARSRTHKYVILFAFPLQRWFRESDSMLRYTYIACLVG
jgi:hypothetical protein